MFDYYLIINTYASKLHLLINLGISTQLYNGVTPIWHPDVCWCSMLMVFC